MSLSTTTRKIVYNANGATTVWAFAFPVLASSHLSVVTTDADGIETTVPSSAYSVTGIGAVNGGTVTYPISGAALVSPITITLVRAVPYTQNDVLSNQGGYYPDVVEKALDRIYMALQQLNEAQGRALTAPISEPPIGFLPSAADRANLVLGFDADGDPTALSWTSDLVAVSAWIQANILPLASANAFFTFMSRPAPIKFFGAVEDGVANDTAAFNAAFVAGVAVQMNGSKRYAVAGAVWGAASDSPGLSSLGGKATIVPYGVNTNSSCIIINKPSDIHIKDIIFEMGISTDPLTPPDWGRALSFAPTGNTGTNYTVEDCLFYGGRNSAFMGGIFVNGRFRNNYITGTWSDGFAAQALDDFIISGNIFADGGYATGAPAPAGAIRVGFSAQLASSRNVEIDGNHISRYCRGSNQSSIDCFSGSGRNFKITNNVLDSNGGSIELKTIDWVIGSPNVYRGHLIAGNLIMLDTDDALGGTAAITLFYAEEGTVAGKAGRTLVTGNMIHGIGVPTGAVGINGVVISGWDDVAIIANHMTNVTNGVVFGSAGESDDTIHRLTLDDNVIDSVGSIFNSTGLTGTIIDLMIKGNKGRATGTANAISFDPGITENFELSDNYFESTQSAVLDLRGVENGRILRNTLKGQTGCIFFQGDASTDVGIGRNDLISAAGPAINVGAGCTDIRVQNNDVDVPDDSFTTTGAGIAGVQSASNNRGMVTADPTGTYGGSVGDYFDNSAPGAVEYSRWVCITTGNVAGAVWKGMGLIAA